MSNSSSKQGVLGGIHYPDSLSCIFNGVVRVDDQAEGQGQSAKALVHFECTF